MGTEGTHCGVVEPTRHTITLLYYVYFIVYVSLCVRGHTQHGGELSESVLSFYHVRPGIKLRLSGSIARATKLPLQCLLF